MNRIFLESAELSRQTLVYLKSSVSALKEIGHDADVAFGELLIEAHEENIRENAEETNPKIQVLEFEDTAVFKKSKERP